MHENALKGCKHTHILTMEVSSGKYLGIGIWKEGIIFNLYHVNIWPFNEKKKRTYSIKQKIGDNMNSGSGSL